MNQDCPKFITIEGIDGSGKSTIIPFMAECIRAKGYDVIITRDPGSTPVGNRLREILLTEPISPMTELKLFDTIRQDMIDQIVKPYITKGSIVLSDRYVDSSFAYQGFGRGLLKEVEEICKNIIMPDKTILLDISLEQSIERMKLRNKNLSVEDRFDSEALKFKERVYEGYQSQAYKDKTRIDKVIASGTIEDTQNNIIEWINKYF